MTADDPMLGTQEERDTYMKLMLDRMNEEAAKDREATAQERARLQHGSGVADQGSPVIIGATGGLNGLASVVP